jgi:serine protease inhibitor
MKKILLALAVLSTAACHESGVERDNSPNLRPLSAAEVQISSGTNDFAFNLFKELQRAEPAKNAFISPLSVSMALGMALNGASDETQQSILKTIDFGDLTAAEVNQGYKDLTELLLSMDKKVTMGIANSVWYKNTFTVSTPFANTIDHYYDGTVQGLNFSDPNTKNVINRWVEKKTNDRIKNLIESIDPEHVMFLVNAIYFKGDWTHQFDKSKTSPRSFTREDGSTTSVSMMFSPAVSMKVANNEAFQLLDIPYGNKQFRLTILLPLGSHKVADIVPEIDTEKLNSLLTGADSLTVEFELPKFKLEWKKDLKKPLQDMGMSIAGFPHFFEDLKSDLEISEVRHQTFLEVNETGSEAAAATSVDIIVTSVNPNPARITIDKPFVFLIREEHSGAFLFMGQITDPAALEN